MSPKTRVISYILLLLTPFSKDEKFDPQITAIADLLTVITKIREKQWRTRVATHWSPRISARPEKAYSLLHKPT